MAKKTNGATIDYILGLAGGGQRKITVPASWKMTFGQLVPYSVKGNMPNGSVGPAALRFYDGTKENLRVVMCDVVSVCDASVDTKDYTQGEVATLKAEIKRGKQTLEEYAIVSGEKMDEGI